MLENLSGVWWTAGDEICGKYEPIDLDSDGFPDIVFSNAYNGSSRNINSTIYWGSGTGYSSTDTFGLPTKDARGNIIADIDSDGFPDLLFANYRDDSGKTRVSSNIYWNSQNGFNPSDNMGLSTKGGFAVSAADLNSDGNPDIFISNGYDSQISSSAIKSNIWLGSDIFQSNCELDTKAARDSIVADFNNDGKLDIFVCNNDDGTSYDTDSFLYYGSTDKFDFSKKAKVPTRGAYGCSAEDLNNDGFLDLVVSNYWSGTHELNSYIYYGSSAGYTTDNRTTVPTIGATGNSIGDLNSDGYPDIVFCNYYDEKSYEQNSYIYWGSVYGYSAALRTNLSTTGAMGCAIGDLNNDSYPDLVFSCHQNGTSYNIDSLIYWGSANGFSPSNLTKLPTSGAYGVTVSDPRVPAGNNAYGSSPTAPPAIALCNSTSGKNYTFSSEVSFVNNPGYVDVKGGILFGLNDTDECFFYAVLNPHRDTVELFRSRANRTVRLGFGNNTVIDQGTAYNLTVDVDGTKAKVFLNGSLFFNVTDANLSAGGYGLYCSLGEAHFVPSMCPDPPSGLRIVGESSRNVVDHQPGLAWNFSDPDEGDRQGMYYIEVYSDEGMTKLCDMSNATGGVSYYHYGSSTYQEQNLTDGMEYYWRVRVSDDHGIRSRWSNIGRFRMNSPPSTPSLSAPSDGRIVNLTDLVFYWDTSNDSEGDNISYYLEIDEAAGNWSAPEAITRVAYTCSTCPVLLSDNRAYFWRVHAFDGFENGSYSPEWRFSVDYDASAPSMPLNLGFSYLGDRLKLTWDRPTHDGGYPVEFYKVNRGSSVDDLNPRYEINATEIQDGEVETGKTYFYRVSAVNAIGEGPPTPVLGVPVGYKPSAPTNLTGDYNGDSVNLTWNEPQWNGYFPVTVFRIYKGETEGNLAFMNTTNGSAFSDIDISFGKVLFYAVSATNDVGEGNLSETVRVPIGRVPSPPRNVAVSVATASIALSWERPADDGGFGIEGYRVFRGEDQLAASFIGECNSSRYDDLSVITGKRYTYHIVAVNLVGSGNASDAVTVIMGHPPSPPSNLTAEWLNGRVKLSWGGPLEDGGFPVLGYRIYRGLMEDRVLQIANTSDTSYTDEGLTNGMRYFYRITAVNILGESDLASISGSPRPVASAVRNLREVTEGRRVQLTWDEPVEQGGNGILYFNIYRSTLGEKSLVGKSYNRSFQDTNLTVGIFRYWVAAHTDSGEGEMSQEVLVYIRNLLPVASFTVKPGNTGGILTTFNFSSSSIDPDGFIVALEWTFGDSGNGSGSSIRHRFGSFGTFAVTLRVVDNDLASASCTMNITVDPSYINRPPRITAARPGGRELTIPIGKAVHINISAEDEDGDDLIYTWQLDGNKLPGITTDNYVFIGRTGGSHKVSVIVSDGFSNATREFRIIVKEDLGAGPSITIVAYITVIFGILAGVGGYMYLRRKPGEQQLTETAEKPGLEEYPPPAIIADLEAGHRGKKEIPPTITIRSEAIKTGGGETVLEEGTVPLPEKLIAPPAIQSSGRLDEESHPGIPPRSRVISNPFKNESEAMMSLSVAIMGLPADLSAMEMEELARLLAISIFRETPDGDIVVRIHGNWYYGDRTQRDTYLQTYHPSHPDK